MIGSQYRYIAVKLRTGWAVWDLAIGQMVRGDVGGEAEAETLAAQLNTERP